jgi:hypothetical protein
MNMSMFNKVTKTFQWGSHTVTMETGEIARQASGAVIVDIEGTVILATVAASKNPKPGQDFFPLTVDYIEKTYAAGKIPGSFFKREAKPSEYETLTSRLIDLLGVKKEDLQGVWNDLGMPSGHAYAKALRTVKTCVGSEWCRFGTQDSTQMGKDLERALWRMYAPHKVKLAVSGCPRNCAESGIKDVGVIGVDSGWEIYVAGNGGIKTEVAQFLAKVKTSEEVLEYAGAFLQLYREEGWYLERTVHYVQRVGLDAIKKKILDDHEGRKALWARLQFALDGEPDPWFEHEKASVDTRQFIPIVAAHEPSMEAEAK